MAVTLGVFVATACFILAGVVMVTPSSTFKSFYSKVQPEADDPKSNWQMIGFGVIFVGMRIMSYFIRQHMKEKGAEEKKVGGGEGAPQAEAPKGAAAESQPAAAAKEGKARRRRA